MHTLLFCYANDRTRPLPDLGREDEGIDRLLDPRASRNHFQKIRESFATTESVAGKLLTYADSLCLFHFSGHAGSTILQLEDTAARGVGIAQLLGRCPNLRLVFLNGCSTLQHVKLLQAQGVKAAVIATSTPVEDDVATRFSQSFYRALVNQYSVEQALDAARLEMQVSTATDIKPVRAALVDDSLAEVSRNQWYFFSPTDEAPRWELPTGADPATLDYKPNDALRAALFGALIAFDADLKEQTLAKRAALPPDALKSWLNEEIMRRLPFPLSEPLRKLFCPALAPDGKLLPAPVNRDRLVNYVSFFESGVDLLVAPLLAQVFDRLMRAHDENQPLTPDAGATQHLQRLLTEGWTNLAPQPLVAALGNLRQFLADTRTPPFVAEIEDLAKRFDEGAAFYESVLFFDDLRKRLASPAGVGNVPSLCQVGEDHLIELAKGLGFWANYRLESYKNIRVIRFFHRPPEYRHERVVLRTSQSYRDDEKYFQEATLKELWECQSVLLVKNAPPGADDAPARFLNLSPLVIDRNVYLKSDNAVFDLYDFHSAADGTLRFKHVGRPEDPLLVIGPDDGERLQQQDFGVLREQFRALRHLVGLGDEAPAAVPAAPAADDLDWLLKLPG